MIDLTCPECGEPCKATVIDVGIGSYECHGYRGNDVQLVTVSDCCEAEFSQHVLEQIGLSETREP